MPGEGGLTGDTLGVGERIGYAQVPIEAHDPTTHRNALVAFGVERDRVYVDEGQSATNRARPGLREAMAARQAGDTLVGARPDLLARLAPASVLPPPGGRPDSSSGSRT